MGKFTHHGWRSLLVIGLIAVQAALASAAPELIEFTTDYTDFAIHPDNGDVCAVESDKNQVVIFHPADLKPGEVKPTFTISVGSTPYGVCFKRFGVLELFAVSCMQDSNLYLIDAKTGKLHKKIELTQTGVSHVASSINPDDPFVYYCFGRGHDSKTGAVNLRTYQTSPAFDDSMDCAISASGQVAYRRGPWSPSGFESMMLTGSLNDDKPAFARLFYDHNSTGQYIPDPFDRYTAAGTALYVRGLESKIATFDYSPALFMKNKPVIFLLGGVSNRPSREKTEKVTIAAASYNTFKNIGTKVNLESKSTGDDSFPNTRTGDFKSIAKKSRLLLDEGRGLLYYAHRKGITTIPIADFELPEEPLLLATLAGPARAIVGTNNDYEIVVKDPKITIKVDDQLEGMQVTGNKLRWQPTPEQVGTVKLNVTLKHGDLDKTQSFDLVAALPSTEIPFAAIDFAVSPDGKQAIVWQGQQLDEFGRVPRGPQSEENALTSFRVALLNFPAGTVAGEKKLPEAPQQAAFFGDYICLGNGTRCDVYKRDGFEKVKSLIMATNLLNIESYGKYLALCSVDTVELYDPVSFARVQTFSSSTATAQPYEGMKSDSSRGMVNQLLTPQGLLARGVLYDKELKPALLLRAEKLPALAGSTPGMTTKYKPMEQAQQRVSPQTMMHLRGESPITVAQEKVPNKNLRIAMELRSQMKQPSGSTHTMRATIEVALVASGDVNARQLLVRQERPSDMNNRVAPTPARLRLADDAAFALYGKQLFRWNLPKANAGAPETPKLQFVSKQATFALSGTGKMQLKHEVTGGRAPLKYTLLSTYDALSIDEKTGVITINEAPILSEAMQNFEQVLVRSTRPGERVVDTFRNQAVDMIATSTELLARKPKGPTIAVPIRLEVNDAEAGSDTLAYFVLAELDSVALLDKLKKLDEERAKKVAETPAVRVFPGPPGPVAAPGPAVEGQLEDSAALRRRVDSLEQRIEMMTRQMNEMQRRLDDSPKVRAEPPRPQPRFEGLKEDQPATKAP